MDFSSMTDAEVDNLHREVTAEQKRRATLSGIPQQIRELADQYRDGGGSEDALQDALTPEEQAALTA